MKNKTVAVLIAFFAGGFGFHKFYLGETVAGILYLIFCWTFIPSILAFFDFLGLALSSEQAFNAKYNGILTPGVYDTLKESSQDKLVTLDKLKKLYDSGVITAEEFEQKRRKILDSL